MIGKTRHGSAAEVEEVFDPEVGKARGVLRRPLPDGQLRHARRRPASELAPWIAHYWLISWDLRGCLPHVAETLPHPNVHMVFEEQGSVVSGVQTRKFVRVLEGRSRVFGIKFRPGGFRPFLMSPVRSLANRTVPVQSIFGKEAAALEILLLSSCKEAEKVEAANAFFRKRMPAPDDTVALAGQLVDRIFREPDLKTVDDLVDRTGIAKRSLQRIFSDYVGIGPKWVIRRYRLHEAIEKVDSHSRPDWAQLALELGYFDQAHLVNDFRFMVGYSPNEYHKLVAKR
jgi:AraC-like DNA-binding protein